MRALLGAALAVGMSCAGRVTEDVFELSPDVDDELSSGGEADLIQDPIVVAIPDVYRSVGLANAPGSTRDFMNVVPGDPAAAQVRQPHQLIDFGPAIRMAVRHSFTQHFATVTVELLPVSPPGAFVLTPDIATTFRMRKTATVVLHGTGPYPITAAGRGDRVGAGAVEHDCGGFSHAERGGDVGRQDKCTRGRHGQQLDGHGREVLGEGVANRHSNGGSEVDELMRLPHLGRGRITGYDVHEVPGRAGRVGEPHRAVDVRDRNDDRILDQIGFTAGRELVVDVR